MRTSYNQIVHCIANLDIQLLNELLDENRTYNDISKTDFISRISEVFDYFRKECGEIKLVPVKGVCGSSLCVNCNSPGITFRGMVSGKYMSLIINVEDDKVTDIFQCKEFKLSNGNVIKDQIKMNIYEEDKIGFVGGVDFHINIQKCEAALSTLKQGKGLKDITFLYYNDILDWVNIYDEVFLEVKDKYLEYRTMLPYIKLYDTIDLILTYLPNGAFINIQESNDCYEEYKISKPHLIPTWVKVLKPYFETHLPLVKYLNATHIASGFLEVSAGYNIRLDISRDKPFLNFMINYLNAQEWVINNQKREN